MFLAFSSLNAQQEPPSHASSRPRKSGGIDRGRRIKERNQYLSHTWYSDKLNPSQECFGVMSAPQDVQYLGEGSEPPHWEQCFASPEKESLGRQVCDDSKSRRSPHVWRGVTFAPQLPQ